MALSKTVNQLTTSMTPGDILNTEYSQLFAAFEGLAVTMRFYPDADVEDAHWSVTITSPDRQTTAFGVGLIEAGWKAVWTHKQTLADKAA